MGSRSKFTRPNHCCCCVNLRLATGILAMLMVLVSIAEILTGITYGDYSRMPIFYTGIVKFLFGIYGLVAVFKQRASMVRIFSFIYWIGVVLQLITYALLFISKSILMYYPCNEIPDHTMTSPYCGRGNSTKAAVVAVSAFAYAIFSIIELHFGFTVRSYYLSLIKSNHPSA